MKRKEGGAMEPYGLVLAGGGAKGAYEMGAWKAMRELGVTFSAVAGVSIGALNGALIAEDNYDGALELWNTITIDRGVNLSTQLRVPDNLFSAKNLPRLLVEILRNRGIDTSPLKELMGAYIHEERVRASKIELGIITFDLSGLKPLELFVQDMPEGKLIDCLLASARCPGLVNQGPDDRRYLDGGVFDNAPIETLRRLGYNRLAVVDISSMKGIGQKQALANCEMVYIAPYNVDELGAAFDFSHEMIEKRLTMGYLDALKAFGKLAGQWFYFEPGDFRELRERVGVQAREQLERLALAANLPRLQVYGWEAFLETLARATDAAPGLRNERSNGLRSRFRLNDDLSAAWRAIEEWKARE